MSDPWVDQWIRRAGREADQLEVEDVFRIAAMAEQNPPERLEAISEFSDGELVFLFDTLNRTGELFTWGLRTGRIQTDPPDAKIVLTTEVLAGLGTFRTEIGQEILRRVGRELQS
jgi:hypothetical protein